MKTMFKSFSMLAVAACAGMSIVSCTSEKDLFNPEVVEQNVKAEYAANFEKKFGAVSADQSWDFATGAMYDLISKDTRATKTFGEVIITDDNEYIVDNNTLTWMKRNLVESQNNKSKGTPFSLKMPINNFKIIPMYQGNSGSEFEFHMVVGTGNDKQDIVIWRKGQDLQQKTEANGNFTAVGNGDSMSALEIKSKEYGISGIAPGTDITFYMLITKGSNDYSHIGDVQSSINGMMVALPYTPENTAGVSERADVMMIGCEVATDKERYPQSKIDWDMNDAVFLIVGEPELPSVERVEDFTESYEKRYMLEDLGVTDDFDFNDVVVDVIKSRVGHHHYTGNYVDNTTYDAWVETASIKHLGGTLDFTLQIGNTVKSFKAQMDGVPANNEGNFDVEGWDPTTNNIRVMVNSRTSGAINVIDFPEDGATPMILAFPLNQPWSGERQTINLAEWLPKTKK